MGCSATDKNVSFPIRGKWQVDLVDGRSIVMPTSAFPCLRRVSVKERKNWYLIGGGVIWDSCPEVIHKCSLGVTISNSIMKYIGC